MIYQIILIIVFTVTHEVSGGCSRLKRPKALQDCYDEVNNYDNEQVGELAVEGCINNYLWTTTKERWHLTHDNKTVEYFDYLWDKYTNDESVDEKEEEKNTTRTKRQIFPGPSGLPRGRCVRKEIRQLTASEWRRTYTCINVMKRNTRLFPNVYEAIARIHNGDSARPAHGGQAFLGWHTIYMLLFEFALRECDSRLCLPYWDSRLDAELDEPNESVFFNLIGGTDGPLQFPFSDWTYQSEGGSTVTVVRGARGSSGRGFLIDYSDYNRLATARTTSEMSRMSASSDRAVVEWPHNGLHVYLRGTVLNLEVAAQDIIFFMLHGFIECIFDRNLRRLRPRFLARRYPIRGSGYPSGHMPLDIMGNLGDRRMRGVRRPIRNRDGYRWIWRRYFRYFPSPTCRNNCRTPRNLLQCCNGRCVSKLFLNGNVVNVCTGNLRGKRQAETNRTSTETNYTSTVASGRYNSYQHPIYNSYALNGVPDEKLWAYVAVGITHVRAHEDSYQCFPVKGNGSYDYTTDIYNPARYESLNKTIVSGYAKPLKKCKTSKSGNGYVYVRTDGINYSGHYEDYAIIDNRLPVFNSVVYVAIKKPCDQNTNVIITAYDECGRVCKPYCPNMKEGTSPYEPCNGLLSIDNKPPLLYGNTLGDTMSMYWNFSPHNLPYVRGRKYCMNFLCDGMTRFLKKSKT